jgi:UrcA family protein
MKICFVVAAAVLLGSSALSAGEPKRSAHTLVVPLRDFDLTRAEDRETLDRRLAAAALRVCRRLADGSAFDQQVVAGCLRRTLAVAREQAALAAAKARSRSSLARNAPAGPAGNEAPARGLDGESK